jgi:hypothetical protein
VAEPTSTPHRPVIGKSPSESPIADRDIAGAVARLVALTGADELLPLRSSVADGLAALGEREGG